MADTTAPGEEPERGTEHEDDRPPPPERAVRAVDRWQGRHQLSGYVVAVVRKYADDRASAFAAQLTHYAFLALFPLLILLLTLLDRLVHTRPDLQERVVDTVLVELPVIGSRLEEAASPLQVDGILVVLGALGLFWGATGFYNAAQLVMSQAWNVEGVDRPGLVWRLVRALALFVVLGVMATVTASAWWGGVFNPSPVVDTFSSLLGGMVVTAVALTIGLRLVTPGVVPWKHLLIPAVVAAPVLEVIQAFGQWIIVERLSGLDDTYGIFAIVLVTISWMNLAVRVVVFCVEGSVVAAEGLWPRRIAQPPLTDADREVLERLARNELRRPEMTIDVRWDDLDEPRGDHVGAEPHPSRSEDAEWASREPGR